MQRTLATLALVAVVGGPALAQADQVEVSRAKLVQSLEPTAGFVDDPFTFDGAGGRLLYVNSDAARRAELKVFDLAQNAPLMTVDISGFTSAPAAVDFALDGSHFFVVARAAGGDTSTAALIDAKGKVRRRFGPATEIVKTSYEGTPAVVLYRFERRTQRKGPDTLRHTVEVLSLESGRRLGKRAVIDTDLQGHSRKLDFTIRYWAEGYTRAVGIKGGDWDPKEDQRSPDHEAWYDMAKNSFVKRVTITDLIEHARIMEILTERDNQARFLAVARDLSGVRVYEGGVERAVELAQPFHRYDPRSLVQHPGDGGTIFFALTIDPVNPDAVARKRTDKRWIELYQLDPGATRAVRRSRIFIASERALSWRATSTHWAVLLRHIGFDRGGKNLLLYRLE
jgi:hypothetical protein